MDERVLHVAEHLMDRLEEKGWRRAPYDLLTRLAVLVGADDVRHLDAVTCGDRRSYEATVVVYTAERLIIQTVEHDRRSRRAHVEVRVVPRSALRSLTSVSDEAVALPLLARWCEALLDSSPRLGAWFEALCERLADRHPRWARHYDRPPVRVPVHLSVRADYEGLADPLVLPLAAVAAQGCDRCADGSCGADEEDFRAFLPSLLDDLAVEPPAAPDEIDLRVAAAPALEDGYAWPPTGTDAGVVQRGWWDGP